MSTSLNKTTLRRRYPGVQPFKVEQKDLFFGRDTDITEMLRLIGQEKLLVLFGKSGYGKSSMLDAGVLPRLGEVFRKKKVISLPVRLKAYVEGESILPIESIKKELAAKVPLTEGGRFYEDIFAGKTLWHEFKRRQTFPIDDDNPEVFVLVFDQFEEFFLYPIEQQGQFRTQIAELIYTDIPQAVFHELGKIKDLAQREHISTSLDVRVVFAIREDRLGYLDTMKTELPAILSKRYQLQGLNDSQAREAIVKPAANEGNFVSPPFTYSDTALDVIVQKLGETKQTVRMGIEAFQLQILCEYLEGEIIAGHIPKQRIEPTHFADKITEIYEGYYHRLLEKLDPSVKKAAQELIEDGLIFSDEKTGESRRLSMDADVLVQRYGHLGVTPDLLRLLENHFLLRRERTATGYNYEVTHDTLIAPIAKSKALRLQESARISALKQIEEAEKLRLENEAKLAEEARRRKEAEALKLEAERQADIAKVAQQKAEAAQIQAEQQTDLAKEAQKRTKKFLTTTIVIAILAIGAGIYAAYISYYAYEQYNSAKNNLMKMELAQKDKNKLQITQLITEAQTYIDADEKIFAIEKIKEILVIDSTHAKALELKQYCESKNNSK
jgi:hypothetical protein